MEFVFFAPLVQVTEYTMCAIFEMVEFWMRNNNTSITYWQFMVGDISLKYTTTNADTRTVGL